LFLDGPSYSEDVKEWYAWEHAHAAADVAIFQTNHQVYDEASPVFYRINAFYFAEDDLPRLDIITCTITFAKRFHGAFAENLRDLTIDALGPVTRRKTVMAALSLLADCTSLKILRLRGSWDFRVEEFDLLCNIKHLKQVDFYCVGVYWSPVYYIWLDIPGGFDRGEATVEQLLTRIMTGGPEPLCAKWSAVLKTWRDRMIHQERDPNWLS
jgi:hypothetical protein